MNTLSIKSQKLCVDNMFIQFILFIQVWLNQKQNIED